MRPDRLSSDPHTVMPLSQIGVHMASKRLTVSVPEDVHEALMAECEEEGRSASDVVREVLMHRYGFNRMATVGEVAEHAIRRGLTNAEALEEVKKAIPAAKTSLDSVSWYRSQLRQRKEGDDVPTDAEIKRQRKQSE